MNKLYSPHVLSQRYGRYIFLLMSFLILFAGGMHLSLGASPQVVFIVAITVLVSFIPMVFWGIYNIPAILTALVGMRFVGFPLFIKLFYLQPLDSYLDNPLGTALVIFIGTIGYVLAAVITNKVSVGKSLLRPVKRGSRLAKISTYAFIVVLFFNFIMAFDEKMPGILVTLSKFYGSFIFLALIASIAYSYKKGKVDISTIIIFLSGLLFGVTRNARSAILFLLIALVLTSQVYRIKLDFRRLIFVGITIGIAFLYLTPIFLKARSQRASRTWQEQVQATIESAVNWDETFVWYQYYQSLAAQYMEGLSGQLTYYGRSTNALDRVSYISTVDIFKVGADEQGLVGFEDLRISLLRATPSFIGVEKPHGYGHGHWLLSQAGNPDQGTYPVVTLLSAGYLAFGWVGVFLYPLVLGSVILLAIKKVSGLFLINNIWAIYFFMRVQNFFVEGATDTYIAIILRTIPQDLLLILLIIAFSKVRISGVSREKPLHLVSYEK